MGMDIIFKDNGTMEVLIQDYIKECIDVFNKEMKKANTPAKHNLFEVNDEEKMNEDKMEVFTT